MTFTLVRRPSLRLAEGLVTHIERQTVDLPLALKRWDDYAAALLNLTWTIHEVPPLDPPPPPDSVSIEDTVVMYRDVAIISRPGSDLREPETEAVESTIRDLDFRVARIVEPGTLDGGDVLKVFDTIYVGLGGRTNRDGIAQFSRIVEPLGAKAISVPVSRVRHLKSPVTALPDGTIIGWNDAVDDVSVFSKCRSMPEESVAHVVIIDDNTLLMAADAPRSADLLRSLGYQVTCVDISEYEKLEGYVTCLSVRPRHH